MCWADGGDGRWAETVTNSSDDLIPSFETELPFCYTSLFSLTSCSHKPFSVWEESLVALTIKQRVT